jgi:hypothetical protein
VPAALGWRGRQPPLQEVLHEQGHWPRDATKPPDPKSAIKWAMSRVGKQTSSSVYRVIAERTGFGGCTDASCDRLRTTLHTWFPPE